MKAFLLDVMVMMMPYMKPILYVGAAAAASGFLLALAKPILGMSWVRLNGLLWSGRIATMVGLFFLACEGMGAMLGAAPQFNLGDSSKFEFWMVPFWQPGLALFVCGLIIGNSLSQARNRLASA